MLELIDRVPVRQALVLGNGIEPAQALYPGTLQPGSPYSHGSFDRVLTIVNYDAEHPGELRRVAFVNRDSFTTPNHARPNTSVADAMAEVAVKHGLKRQLVAVGGSSHSIVGGVVEALQKGLIDPRQPLLIVSHQKQAPRTLKYAQLAMPRSQLQPLFADHLSLGREYYQPDPNRTDKLAELVYDHALQGVEPGDIETMKRRDNYVQLVLAPVVALRGIARKIA